MTSALREQAGRSRRMQKRLAFALAAVLGGGVLAAYLPMRRAIEQTRQDLARCEADLIANRDRAATLPVLIATVNGLRREVDLYKPLRGRSDIERAMHEIGSINTATRLANYTYKSGPEVAHPSCREAPLQITFEADFIDAMSFVQKLESMDRLTRVRSLSIHAKPGTAGAVGVTMSLSLFFDASDPQDDAPSAGADRGHP